MRIKSAAIKLRDGRIFDNRCHAMCMRDAKEAGVEFPIECVEGFLTDDDVFVTREKAARIAYDAGQTSEHKGVLYSGDIF